MVICFGIINLPGVILINLLALIPGIANWDFFSIGMAPVGLYLLMILATELSVLLAAMLSRKLGKHQQARSLINRT